MTNVEVVNLMSTSRKREYIIKLSKEVDISQVPQNWHLPLLVSIEYLPYEHKASDGKISEYTMENVVSIKDAIGNELYHGTVVKGEHPYAAEDNGNYNYDAEKVIGMFSDPQCSLNERDVDALIEFLFKDLISTSGESTDHDCECCGWFTNSTVILSHNSIECEDITYEYDGHFGYGYVPTLLDVISFALTGEANTTFPDDDYY